MSKDTNTAQQPAGPVIRVMADYLATYGIWHAGDGDKRGELDVAGLQLSRELLQRFKAWCAWYDRECESFLPLPERNPARPFDYARFAATGLELAKQLKRELPGYTIHYIDEAKLEAEVQEAARENRDIARGMACHLVELT